jgi:ankyrin repeat protein
MSFIYNAMKDEPGSSLSTRLDFFFSGRGTPLQKSSLGMFRALLNQLYIQRPTIRGPIRKVFEDKQAAFGSGGHQWEWQRQELERLFLQAALEAAQSRSLVIFVDALDEAGTISAREIAAYFHQLNDASLSATKSKIRICISCRHYPVPSTISGSEIWVENLNGNDITSFIQDKLRIEVLAGAQPDERLAWKTLVEELTRRASGVFQWARLVVPMAAKYIDDGESPSEIRRRLREVPEELSAVYKHILEQVIDRANRPRTLLLLRWVCLASQPLTVTELRVALAAAKAKISPDRYRYLDTEDFGDTDNRMERLIVSLSGGLVETISDEENTDKRVQVIHQSVNDFLVPDGLATLSSLTGEVKKAHCHEMLKSDPWHVVQRSHGLLFRGCLNYISLEEVRFKADFDGDEHVESPTPFIRYAVTQLFHHAQQSNEHYFSDEEFLVQLNELHYMLPKWVRLFRALNKWQRYFPARDTIVLHVACQFSLIDIVTELLQQGTNPEQEDGEGRRSIHFAAKNGQIAIVRALLTAGAEIEPKDHDGQTPLVHAAGSGHEEIVRLLVDSGGQINQMTGSSGNALQQAAMTGKVALVRFLITAGAEVNAQGGEYGNALQAASYGGEEQVVRLLIEKGAEVNAQGGEYGNTLQAASYGGEEQVVRLLIENGAEVNAQGGEYGNALQAASAEGHEQVVRLLMEKGAEVNAQGGDYGNALQAASWRGNEQVVRLLIENGAEVNAQGGDYGNALQAASYGGEEQVVRLLMENGAEVNAQGGEYGNALQAASYKGHEQVVRLLIEKGAEVNAQGGEYGNALQAASWRGNEQVVRLLIKNGAEVNAQGGYFGNALQAASARRKEQVVRLLMENGADVNAPARSENL